jgi:hypothetical protein
VKEAGQSPPAFANNDELDDSEVSPKLSVQVPLVSEDPISSRALGMVALTDAMHENDDGNVREEIKPSNELDLSLEGNPRLLKQFAMAEEQSGKGRKTFRFSKPNAHESGNAISELNTEVSSRNKRKSPDAKRSRNTTSRKVPRTERTGTAIENLATPDTEMHELSLPVVDQSQNRSHARQQPLSGPVTTGESSASSVADNSALQFDRTKDGFLPYRYASGHGFGGERSNSVDFHSPSALQLTSEQSTTGNDPGPATVLSQPAFAGTTPGYSPCPPTFGSQSFASGVESQPVIPDLQIAHFHHGLHLPLSGQLAQTQHTNQALSGQTGFPFTSPQVTSEDVTSPSLYTPSTVLSSPEGADFQQSMIYGSIFSNGSGPAGPLDMNSPDTLHFGQAQHSLEYKPPHERVMQLSVIPEHALSVRTGRLEQQGYHVPYQQHDQFGMHQSR